MLSHGVAVTWVNNKAVLPVLDLKWDTTGAACYDGDSFVETGEVKLVSSLKNYWSCYNLRFADFDFKPFSG